MSMTCDSTFKFYSYLLLIASFLTLLLSGGLSAPLAVVYLLAVGVSWRRSLSFLSGRYQFLVVLSLLACLVVDAGLLTNFMDALIHLLLLVSLVKLFSLRTGRDYLILYLISFVFVLLASSYTISILFLIGLAVFLFCSIVAFMLHETRKAYAENQKLPFSHRAYLQMALVVTALIVLFSVPLFVVIPRTPMGFFATAGHGLTSLTGFSNTVSLGDMGRILNDSRMVMRVRVELTGEATPTGLKWRGVGLDRFDGKNWVNTRSRDLRLLRNESYGAYLVQRVRRQKEALIRQVFYVEPFSNVVFAAPDAIMISRAAGRRGFVVQDGNDSYSFASFLPERAIYSVYSDVSPRWSKIAAARLAKIQELDPDLTPQEREEFIERYLQLPPISDRIGKLAMKITAGANHPIDASLAIERFLRSNYAYNLDNASGSAADPLYDFLFVTKAGHCEYFATAQAILMRYLGIPCRLVNGFQQGEYNNWSGHFVVRQSDAHSWVEGYFGSAGWVEFDPTPPGRPSSPYFLARIGSEWLDALDTFWTDLMSFDRMRQITLFHSAGTWLIEKWESTQGIGGIIDRLKARAYTSLGGMRKSVPILSLWALALLPLVWFLSRYRRLASLLFKKKVLRRSSDRLAPDYYREMLEILRRKGHIKKEAETPLEFALRLGSLSLVSPAVSLTQTYYRARFGNLPLGTSDFTEIQQTLHQLRRAV